MTTLTRDDPSRLWRYAMWLALFTILYNLAEGLISVYFGAADETLTLFGFGLDSFIEVLSGIGILTMIIRITRNPGEPRSRFERTALRVTGLSFYALALGLGVTAAYNLWTGHAPTSTLPGVIVSVLSIGAMWALIAGKWEVGRRLNSAPILADANCTKVCIYMSAVLLTSSAVYQLLGIGWVDSLGAAGLIYFSVREGREAFEKAAGLEEACDADGALG